jgi:hypothetical protein
MDKIYMVSAIEYHEDAELKSHNISNGSLCIKAVGWFKDFNEAEKAVLNNTTDLYETCHNYAVIETLPPGIKKIPLQKTFYKIKPPVYQENEKHDTYDPTKFKYQLMDEEDLPVELAITLAFWTFISEEVDEERPGESAWGTK